jgi:hypothetical protein
MSLQLGQERQFNARCARAVSMAALSRTLRLLVFSALGLAVCLRSAAGAEAPTESQVEAVFVFNFSHFVEWPSQTFASATEPFVIGILGSDPFGARLDEAVRGEQLNGHPLTVRRFRSVAEIENCQILFIDRSEAGRIAQILSALQGRSTLTVSQADRAAERGVMVQFTTENSRIRLRINVEAARAAGLAISSNLLRPAEIVAAGGKE